MKLSVKNGIDCLKSSLFGKQLAKKKVGLITNVTGLTKDFVSSVSVLDELCQLERLFAPEHGIRGERQAGETVSNYFDLYFQKEVISLYGEKKAPDLSEIRDLDYLFYDIQDIGSRYYTYIYTMYLSLKKAKEANVTFVVLDRIDVFGGDQIFGEVIPDIYYSFVGMLPLPNVYGLTVGELAQFCNVELGIEADLVVIPVEGWQRGVSLAETDLPWVMPSPNIPSVETAWLYTGTCLFEGTNLSEGRGTTKPFEIIGAPWIDGSLLAQEMNALTFPGVKFRPVFFTPTFSKYKNENCQGIQIHLLDWKKTAPLSIAYTLLNWLNRTYPDKLAIDVPFEKSEHLFFTHLAGHPFSDSYTNEASKQTFLEKRQRHLIYK